MIKLKQIEDFTKATPFRPFALETSGGNHLLVTNPDRIKLPPEGFDLILIYGEEGLVHYIDQATVLNAAVYGPEPRT